MMKNALIDTTFRKTVAGLELRRRFVTQLHRKILLKISSYILRIVVSMETQVFTL